MVESPAVYESTGKETVCDTVVRAVADSKDVDPTGMELTLYDAVDPDALNRFFDSRAGSTGRRVCFTFADRRVVVDESRTVYVTDASDRADEPRSTSSTPQVLRGAASPWRMVSSTR